MIVEWSPIALDDLVRLHDFLAARAPDAAARILHRLSAEPMKLRDYPRRGMRIERYRSREIRRLNVGDYEMQYELRGDVIAVLGIWHHREDR